MKSPALKPVNPKDRRVVNIAEAERFRPWTGDDGSATGQLILQLDEEQPLGIGFHVYRMEPGTVTDPHEHNGHEQFLVLEGELTDHDGTVYRQGDLVWLRDGSCHFSHSERGCLLAVHIAGPERPLD